MISTSTERSSKDRMLDAAYYEVYKHGFQSASTAAILKKAGVPKGSMYHHFGSKKELVLAVLEERIAPKICFFYRIPSHQDPLRAIYGFIDKVLDHETLMTYGCPLHRLTVEMGALDEEFATAVNKHYFPVRDIFKDALDRAISMKRLHTTDTESLAHFMIASVWGALSAPPSLSTPEQIKNTLAHLKNYLHTLEISSE